jgi:hypothetical protein
MKTSIYVVLSIFLLVVAMGHTRAMESSSITGAVYCDHNHNGQLDNEEKGLENIHVQIFIDECSGTALQTVHTNKDGNFTFHGFDPNTYFIRSDVPCVCGGRMPTTNTCQKVELKEGETVILPPFGYSEYGQ